MSPWKKSALAAALGLSAAGAPAQQPDTSAAAPVYPDRSAQVRALGPSMDPAAASAPYRDALGPEFWQGITITRGIAYAGDPKNELDIYMPDGEVTAATARRPVLVFVHGGGFRGGSRTGQPYPDNVPAWAVHSGMVGVSIDYRLAPASPWPAAANDLSAALKWVREHIAEYGGDPDRIVLFGHSAGANHVADYVAHGEVQGPEVAGIKGAIMLSPYYADAVTAESPPHAYYGTDAALQTAHPIVEGLRGSHIPLFLGNAEFDPQFMQDFGQKAHDWLCEQPERCPGYVHLADHNHFTEGMALGTRDTSLSAPLLAWMKLNGVF